jgi:uncharacterized protein (DUF305 family)
MENMNTRRFAALAAAIALTLSACGSGNDSASDSAGHNDADVAFATEMIPHHAQALLMVDMTMGREVDPEFRELTEDIRAAQTPEIETMADWLEEWGEPVPETPRDHANAHGDGHGMGPGADMPGMMSGQDLDDLESSRAERFEEMWLQMMIEHHEGAIEMAQVEQEEGSFAPALELAQRIERTQEAEIAKMEDLLAS